MVKSGHSTQEFQALVAKSYAPVKMNSYPPPLWDTGGDWYGNVSKTGKMPQYMGTLCGDTI